MKLKKLLEDLPVKTYGSVKDLHLTGLCAHSKRVAPGNLFIAKHGSVNDGSKYIDEAISSGAVAILTDFHDPFCKVTQIIHPNVSAIEAEFACRFYGDASRNLFTIGVTGTNGKTTVTHLLQQILDSFGISCGLIGTIEYRIGPHRFEAERTTPDVVTNHKMLHEMVRKKCQAVAMEVSSHGLAQGRTEKIQFDVAIFTNLTQDHLDYHKTMEAYAHEKSRLFETLAPDALAIVNRESPWWKSMVSHCSAKVVSYGFDAEADIYAHEIKLGPEQTQFLVTFEGQTVPFTLPLIGRFNVLNCLAAITPLLLQGYTLQDLGACVKETFLVRGRLERVFAPNAPHIFVDYAHTPDALENVLHTLNEIKGTGRVFTVFGCGGDRDATKRPIMGRIASHLSDRVIITADNPRTEDPLNICREIAAGCASDNFLIEPDRRLAIVSAIERAQSGDLILIAGKGHETYQIFAHQTRPFDDKSIVQDVLDKMVSSL